MQQENCIKIRKVANNFVSTSYVRHYKFILKLMAVSEFCIRNTHSTRLLHVISQTEVTLSSPTAKLFLPFKMLHLKFT